MELELFTQALTVTRMLSQDWTPCFFDCKFSAHSIFTIITVLLSINHDIEEYKNLKTQVLSSSW